MEYIVDRLEEGFVVLEQEDRSHLTVPVHLFEVPPKEGDVAEKTISGYRVNPQKTQIRRERIAALQKSLFCGKKGNEK